ncbi:MAG: hypothetical protein OXP75_06775 [Rhodospirillales bacterium]|nr:hypothetical protein [Rhodospirillales bacterium]
MPYRPRFHPLSGKQLAVGEGEWTEGHEETVRRLRAAEPAPAFPERPCCKCGRRFKPTFKRRMTCEGCYQYADDGQPVYLDLPSL